MSLSRSLFAISLLVCAISLSAQNNVDPSGHWEGIIHAPATDVVVAVDLAKNATGDLTGTFSNAADNIHDLPLANVRAKGNVVTFAIAAVSYRFLERPIRRHGVPFGRPQYIVPAAVALSVFLIVRATYARTPVSLRGTPKRSLRSCEPSVRKCSCSEGRSARESSLIGMVILARV